jgi:hypothetical protein
MPVTGHRLDDRCCKPMRLFLGLNKSPVQRIPVVQSPRVRGLECEASHSLSSGDDVSNAWSYTSTPTYTEYSLSEPKHKGDITFLFGVLENVLDV